MCNTVAYEVHIVSWLIFSHSHRARFDDGRYNSTSSRTYFRMPMKIVLYNRVGSIFHFKTYYDIFVRYAKAVRQCEICRAHIWPPLLKPARLLHLFCLVLIFRWLFLFPILSNYFKSKINSKQCKQ